MLTKLTVFEAKEKIIKKEITPRELVDAYRKNIEDKEDLVKAYVTVSEKAKNEFKEEELDLNKTLWGIPAALKDNICTRGLATTCASKMLENYIPPYNATVVNSLKNAGVTFLGKTNMDEFAMGSSTENSAFFNTRNPWSLDRVPGGSSGGSAAAVAAGEAAFALGSDTGGSIRQPAAYCGVVGMKPTYGRVSRYGLIAFASSLDQIGSLTKDVRDCALVMNAICGHDSKDSTSLKEETPDFTSYLGRDTKGLKIGVPKEYMSTGIDIGVKEVIKKTLSIMEDDLKIQIEEISLPHTEYALPAYYLIAPAEASSNLARYDGLKYGFHSEGKDLWETIINSRSYGFGDEVKRRIMIGTYALSSGYYDAYYLKALKIRTLIKEDFDNAFSKYDLIITPTTPTTAFKFKEKTVDPITMYLNDVCTIPANLAGLPAISLPCGFSKGLPVGLQIIGPALSEAEIIKVAYAFEQATSHHLQKPGFLKGGKI